VGVVEFVIRGLTFQAESIGEGDNSQGFGEKMGMSV
jgi:hypothetical protein